MQTPTDPLARTGADAGQPASPAAQHTEILILPEGRVLVHNLTPMMAAILEQLNPSATEIRDRVAVSRAPDASGGLTPGIGL